MLWTVFSRPGIVMSGADRARLHTLVEGRLRHVEAEVLPPVGGVEEHPSLLGIDDLGDHSPIVVQNPARVAGEQVRDDVPGLQQRQQVARYSRPIGRTAVSNVYHKAHTALVGRQLGELDHLHA